MDDVRVVSLEETIKAFQHWTKSVKDSSGEPLIIHEVDAVRAAEAFLASVDAVRE